MQLNLSIDPDLMEDAALRACGRDRSPILFLSAYALAAIVMYW